MLRTRCEVSGYVDGLGLDGMGREKRIRFNGCSVVPVVFLLFFGEWAGDTTMRGSGAWEVLSCSAVSVYLGRPTAQISTS